MSEFGLNITNDIERFAARLAALLEARLVASRRSAKVAY